MTAMKFTSFLIFGVGVALGVGASCAVKSRKGRTLAIALASKGLELKDRLACMADRMKKSTFSTTVSETTFVL